MITRVVRKTALGTAIFLEIPLLKGESVTSEDIRVEKGNALINIASNQSEITWMSVLEKQETITLLLAIEKGLLGHPNMHIAGNGSSAYYLRWYEDRTGGLLPQVWVFSLSMWVYRIAMLLWALWISFALLRWLRWGWSCFSTHGLWKSFSK